MPHTYWASDHKDWEAAGLKEFGEYAECVEYVNQRPSGFGVYEGEWYHVDEERHVVYSGTFGNDHSPGTMNTVAEAFALPDEEQEYIERITGWQNNPEFVDEEGEESDIEDDEEPDDPTDVFAEGPEEGDYTTTDHRKFYQHGRPAVEVPPDEDWRFRVKAHMDRAKFWPDVWLLSDHGDAHLLSFEE